MDVSNALLQKTIHRLRWPLLGGIGLLCLGWIGITHGEAIIGDPVQGANDPILGTKHDFNGLNERAGVAAMPGVAFSDYGNSCVYCHIPPEKATADGSAKGAIEGWNRFQPATNEYELYTSGYIDSPTHTPSPISLLCLSCHDGTMGVDMVVFKPGSFKTAEDTAMHMRINGADNTVSCGKCHNGRVAHDISIKHLGQDLRNDHPISMRYGGLPNGYRTEQFPNTTDVRFSSDPDFRRPHTAEGFENGVRLYDGKVECASCHNVHDPSKDLLLRANSDLLCQTCHTK
ncbi:MAG: cytochrome c3 family protein [Gammaproteobacteria bacterium]|nr:cytochrome c3 family protein [Gammaproteobacteria bacterium]